MDKPKPIDAELILKDFALEKAERELAMLRYDNQHLIAHIRRLEREEQESRRIRSRLKMLFEALDAAVLVRLNRLDRSETQAPTLSTTRSMARGEVLHAIRLYDMESFFPPAPTKTYQIAYRTYRGVTGFGNRSVRGGVKALRMLRGSKNGQ